MVKHVILWKLKEEYSAEEKAKIIAEIKAGLESLNGVIPGLISCKVYDANIATSNCDLMLDTSFETREALAAYSKNPAHVTVADSTVRPFICARNCIDFEI